MHFKACFLFAFAGIIAPSMASPLPTGPTIKPNTHYLAAIEHRALPNIKKQIRDAAAVESRAIPDIEKQIHDPAAIEG